MIRILGPVVLSLFLCAAPAKAQAPLANAADEQAKTAALVREIQAQQQEMAANQVKIDEKLAALAEAVRQARIYASRGGK